MKKFIIVLPVLLIFAFSCKKNEKTSPPQIDNKPVPEIPASEVLSAYSVSILQGGNSNTVDGYIYEDETPVTLTPLSNDWIANLGAAVASFELMDPAYELRNTDRVKHYSGVTAVDLNQEMEYIAYKSGTAIGKFKVRLVSPQTSGLPVINIATTGGAPVVNKVDYVKGTLDVIDANEPDHNISGAALGIRYRGNSTLSYPKKPYRIKFDKKTSMFGYGKAKSWVLLANYLDPTLSTAAIAFEVARRLGFPNANHIIPVEVFLNGKYQGNYSFTEQVQVNEHRVDIDEEAGFLLELDDNWLDPQDITFYTDILSIPATFKTPEDESHAGVALGKQMLNSLEAKLFGGEGGAPSPEWRDLVDIPVLIDYMIIYEIAKNNELYHPKSVFLHCPGEGQKIVFGPLWDFDWAYGYNGQGDYFTGKGAFLFPRDPGDTKAGEKFFVQFFKDPDFTAAYKARWNEVKPLLAGIDEYIRGLGEYMSLSARENDEEWKEVRKAHFGKYKDFATEIENMAVWILEQIDVLDTTINSF